MAKSTLEVIIQLIKRGGGDKDAVRGLLDIKRAWTEALMVAGTAAAAYAIVDKVFIQNANRAADYALKIDDLSRVTGIQVEQMSRLVQAADDVRISQETLTTGLEFAVRQGYEPSVEWLGQMADRINGLPPGAARAKAAVELFGKAAGPDMLRLLELGQGGIEEYMASVGDGLVVTQESIDQAREYKQTVDELNDTWEELKTGLGQDVIPVLDLIIRYFMDGTQAILALGDGLRTAFSGDVEGNLRAQERFMENYSSLSNKMLEFLGMAPEAYKFEEKVAEGLGDIGDEAADVSSQMRDLGSIANQSLEEVSSSAYATALAMDGVFDMSDQQRLLDYQLQMGMITREEYNAKMQALELSQALEGLPADIPVNIRITITRAMGYGATAQEAQWLASNPALQGVPGLAEGGPLGMANIVGERGWEAIVERPDGEHVVIPHEMSRFLMEQGLLPVSGVYGGGGPIGGGIVKGSKRTLVNSMIKSGTSSGTKGWSSEGSTSTWKPESSSDPSGSGGVNAVMAASAAAEAVAPLVQDTMNTFAASTQQNSAQVSQQTQMVERTSDAQLAELRGMRRDIQALAEQLAAEIKK